MRLGRGEGTARVTRGCEDEGASLWAHSFWRDEGVPSPCRGEGANRTGPALRPPSKVKRMDETLWLQGRGTRLLFPADESTRVCVEWRHLLGQSPLLPPPLPPQTNCRVLELGVDSGGASAIPGYKVALSRVTGRAELNTRAGCRGPEVESNWLCGGRHCLAL